MATRRTAKVSVVDPFFTPSSFRYPRTCPRTTSLGAIARTCASRRLRSSRSASCPGCVGKLHREAGDDLEHVILNDVPDGADGVVEARAPLDSESLGHRDLHALDPVAVEAALEERIGGAKVDDVLDRLFAEIMVDSENGLFGKEGIERLAQRLGRGRVVPEGLFEDQASSLRQPDGRQVRRHLLEEIGRKRDVVQRMFRIAQRGSNALERRRVVVVDGDVLELAGERFEGRTVDTAVRRQTLFRAVDERLFSERLSSDRDDRHR